MFNLITMGGFELNHQWHGINMLSVLECALLAALLCSVLSVVFIRRKRLMILSAIGALSFATAAYAASTALSALTASGAIAGANLIYVVQTAGTGGVKATFTQVLTFVMAQFSQDFTCGSTGVCTVAKINNVAVGTAATVNTGTSGATIPLLNGTNTFSGTQTFGTVIGSLNSQTAAYTLVASDCGKHILITSASGVALTTLNSLPVGCTISVEQGGAGQITVTNGSGATFTSAHSYTKTFNAVGAIIGLYVDTNTGTNAHFVLTGDGA